MSALSSTFAVIKPLSSALGFPSGRPTASVTSLRAVQSHSSVPQVPSLFAMPREPEDARITGGTRSLDRRLLALNLSGSRLRARPAPERGPFSEFSAVA